MESSYPGAPRRSGTGAAVLGLLIFLVLWNIITLAVCGATLHQAYAVKNDIAAAATNGTVT